MRQIRLTILIILFIVTSNWLSCAICNGANEINAFCPGVSTAYAIVREVDGDVWYVSGQAFEAWGTGGRTAADYDIALTDKEGDLFVGNFDTNISSGNYWLVTHYQAGGAPADTDPVIWADYGNWTGSAWSSGGTITATEVADSVWDEAIADHTAEATFGGEVQSLDPNVTAILADTNELQTDWTNGGRLDVIIDAIKAITDLLPLVTTVINEPNDANNFSVTDGKASDDAFTGCWVMVEDADDSNRELRLITQWNDSLEIDVDFPFSFTPAASDNVWIWTGYLGDLLEQLDRINQTTNVFDMRGTTTTGQGMTIYNAAGEDP